MNEKEILEQLKEINKKLDKKHDVSDVWIMLMFAAGLVMILVDKVLTVIYG